MSLYGIELLFVTYRAVFYSILLLGVTSTFSLGNSLPILKPVVTAARLMRKNIFLKLVPRKL